MIKIKNADVLVQNLAPGAAARLGLGYEALTDEYPALIVCDISGYGDDAAHPGPYRGKKAYDLLIQSEAGFLSITGTPDEPAKAGCSIADIAAGSAESGRRRAEQPFAHQAVFEFADLRGQRVAALLDRDP